jgi:hypothetical protein
MPLSAPQQEVADSRARFKVLITGRRFGKTHLCIREICRHATRPNSKIFYVSPSYRQAKQICWDELKNRLRPLNWIAKINETDLSIRLVNGSIIALRGADNYDSLRGVRLDYCVLDEIADIEQKAWTEVLRPTLSDTGGGALFCGTPKGRGNWSFDLYTHAGTDKAWARWQFTTLDGGFIPEEEVLQAQADLDDRTYRQEYLGSFETYSGAIYYKFNTEENVKKFTYDPESVLHIGADNNVDPHMACVAVKTKSGLHVIDDIKIIGSSTEILCTEIRNRYPKNPIVMYPDPAGNQRRTSAGGKTDMTIMRNAGFQVLARHRHPAVKDRINAVNSLLCNQAGERRLTVDPTCRNVIQSLSRQTYKPGTQIPDDGDLSHMADALGYMVEYLHPVTTNINTNKEPQVFKHRTY